MNQQVRDLIELHFLVMLWGLTAVLGLLITLPSVEIVFFRTLISCLLLGIGLWVLGKKFRVSPGELTRLFIVGFLFAAHWILFFWAAKVSNASLCLAGMATTALWSGFLEPIAANKKVSRLEIVLSLTSLLGISIVLSVELDRALGLVLALGAALMASLFTIANKTLVTRHDPFKIMFYEMMGATVAITLFLPFYRYCFSDGLLRLNPSGHDWLYLLVLAIVCTVYAYTMSVKLLKRISAVTVNFTINLEPVYGIILAFVILGESERMHIGFYLGTLLILLAVLLHPVLKKKLEGRSV